MNNSKNIYIWWHVRNMGGIFNTWRIRNFVILTRKKRRKKPPPLNNEFLDGPSLRGNCRFIFSNIDTFILKIIKEVSTWDEEEEDCILY